MDEGFDIFNLAASKVWMQGSALPLYQQIETLLKKNADRPVFVYIHSMDPHDPYTPFSPYDKICDPPADDLVHQRLRSKTSGFLNKESSKIELLPLSEVEDRYIRSYYRGEIRQMDSYFFAVMSLLESTGLLDDTIVSVTADHGEEFGEHGVYQHGVTLYESVVRVPWILYYPKRIMQSVLQSGLVSTIDMPKTLLNLADIDTDAPFQGFCAYPRAVNYPQDRKVFLVVRHNDQGDSSRWRCRSICLGSRKLTWVSGHGVRSFNLETHPDESKHQFWQDWNEFNASEIDTTWKYLGSELQMFIDRTLLKVDKKISTRQADQLRALGYIE